MRKYFILIIILGLVSHNHIHAKIITNNISTESPELNSGSKKLKGLVVLIDFPDQPGWLSKERAEKLLNKKKYREGSVNRTVREYWLEQSRNEIDITHDVTGYYRAPHPLSWYKERDWRTAILLFKDALDWMVKEYPDYKWNSLSLAEGDLATQKGEEGSFLSINFIPSASFPGAGATHHLDWTAPNGVKTRQIVGITVTRRKEDGVNLFGFNHELGHSIFGIPDTYDTDGSSHGTGVYTVMSGNKPDVEPLGAPFLAEKGWVEVIDIEKSEIIILKEDGDVVARFKNPNNPDEYFVIEARNQSNIGNSSFPVPRGLIIWHVDNSIKSSNKIELREADSHYRVSVEQADGKFDLENKKNRGDSGDIYQTGDIFTVSSTPDSNWWSGKSSGLNINNIKFLSNNSISFEVNLFR